MDPAAARALAERVAASMHARDTATQALGIRIVRVEPGSAELAMVVRMDMLNGHDICHGGFIFALADSAFAYACNSYNLNTVASGCAIEFTAPAHGGETLTARAHERHPKRLIGLATLPGAPACTTWRSRTSAARPSRCFAARAIGSRAI